MPTPFLHLPLAHDVANALMLSTDELPSFLLGSVAPDLAQWLHRSRGETHFWQLDNDVSGAVRLLREHPSLRATDLASSERAFIAGYLCHLVTDEQWTFCIWRPYFGKHTPFGGGPLGAATQSLFRDVLDDRERARALSPAALATCVASAALIRENLCPWLNVRELDQYREMLVSRLCARSPLVVTNEHREALTLVRPNSVHAFRSRATTESVKLIKSFLRGGEPEPPLGTAMLAPAGCDVTSVT